MTTKSIGWRNGCELLPIVPKDVLQRFHVADVADTRFSACARLLQSIWRERRGLAIGRHRPVNGRPRKLGSRVAKEAGRTGVNFLTADIAKLARKETAYREIGALIEECRLWENLLSSQALTFNLFARAKIDAAYAVKLFDRLIPGFMSNIDRIMFEHSPGRGDPTYLGDYSAFDVFAIGTSEDGSPSIIAIEVKYAENMQQQPRSHNQRYRELTREFVLHLDPDEPSLLTQPLAQLTAEHLLVALVRETLGAKARGVFMTVAPASNREAWNALELYRTKLSESDNAIPVVSLSLETVIGAIDEIGDGELASQLRERYTDFTPIHELIEEWEPFVE